MRVHAAPPPTPDIPAQWEQGARLPLKCGPHGKRVSAYRFFMLLVFTCIVLADVWADLKTPAAVIHMVGSLSVLVWALTMLGGLELGPLAIVRNALRRR